MVDGSDSEYKKKVPDFLHIATAPTVTAAKQSSIDYRVPTKLLIELASLSSEKFRVELKSRTQSITLPLQDNSNHSNTPREDDIAAAFNLSNDDIKDSTLRIAGSALEKNYITLTCLIVNKQVALVPPIRILLPYNYPEMNPLVDCVQMYDNDDDMLPGYSK